jgi:hypothetical protein
VSLVDVFVQLPTRTARLRVYEAFAVELGPHEALLLNHTFDRVDLYMSGVGEERVVTDLVATAHLIAGIAQLPLFSDSTDNGEKSAVNGEIYFSLIFLFLFLFIFLFLYIFIFIYQI